jgi:hypothetical protein
MEGRGLILGGGGKEDKESLGLERGIGVGIFGGEKEGLGVHGDYRGGSCSLCLRKKTNRKLPYDQVKGLTLGCSEEGQEVDC